MEKALPGEGPVPLGELPVDRFVIAQSDLAHALGSAELKPCPHCGRWAFSIGTLNPNTGNTVYHVNCTGTDCMARAFFCAKDPSEARAGAVARWNRRAVPASA